MIKQLFYLLNLLIIPLLLISCNSNPETKISGTIDYVGDADFYIEIPPLHYKYSEKTRIPLTVNNGSFETNLDLESSQIIHLVLQDIQYPIYYEPNEDISINIMRARFPL
ncbi:hypothetical protein, partial [Winogradskyella sp.]